MKANNKYQNDLIIWIGVSNLVISLFHVGLKIYTLVKCKGKVTREDISNEILKGFKINRDWTK